MSQIKFILSIACNPNLLKRAIKIAFVVGIILNLINQGEYILGMDMGNLNYPKAILTFFVPFCVSMYTAVTMKMKFQMGERAMATAHLRCKVCNSCSFVKINETIPCCKKCQEKTIWKVTNEHDKKCQ